MYVLYCVCVHVCFIDLLVLVAVFTEFTCEINVTWPKKHVFICS